MNSEEIRVCREYSKLQFESISQIIPSLIDTLQISKYKMLKAF